MSINSLNSYKSFRKLLLEILNVNRKDEEKAILIEDFMDRNKEINFPIINGRDVFFLYYGEAELVSVVGDFNGWDSFDKTSQMIKLGDTNLFYLKKSFELDARIDYQIIVDTEWMTDPLNKNKILGGFGYNSELRMPVYKSLRINSNSVRLIKHGIVEKITFRSELQKDTCRKIYVYLPYTYRSNKSKRYFSFYAVDGTDFIQAGDAIEILDELIYFKKIPPVIGIFIDPVEPGLRIQDFNGKNCSSANIKNICREFYCKMLINELIPYIDKNYRTIQHDPEARSHIGVSLGGILSTYVASRFPEYFRLVGSQSGSYWIDTEITEFLTESKSNKQLKFYLNAGTYEKRNYEHTKNLEKVLKNKSYNVMAKYYNQGHSWGLWKDTFGEMLEYLFNTQ